MAMRSTALRDPTASGLNVTLIAQLAPADNVVPQVLVRAKSAVLVPVKEMLRDVSVVVPMFFSVTVCAALVVLTVWLAKVTFVGLTVTPLPTPLSETV